MHEEHVLAAGTNALEYRTYGVDRGSKQLLLDFILDGLSDSGCRVIQCSRADHAPFRVTFEMASGERLGIVAYAFFANSKSTKNRPSDEHRFQVKYGSKDGKLHELWQDPYGLYTTLFLGIDPERQVFVGADPVLHSPTRMFISIEYKSHHVESILESGWTAWERETRKGDASPVEVLVGGKKDAFLRYVLFEREALGEDQGHRQLIAEKDVSSFLSVPLYQASRQPPTVYPSPSRVHLLAREFELSETEVLDLISGAPRLKMAVRGWVAEEHLYRRICQLPGVTHCERIRDEGAPDLALVYRGKRLVVECKNVLRRTTGDGLARLDFQRTRASKSDPCSRYYRLDEFDVVAACLHAVTERWEFRFTNPWLLDKHLKCPGRLSNNVKLDDRWREDPLDALRRAAA